MAVVYVGIARTEPVDKELAQQVDEAGGTLHLGIGTLVVLVARIGRNQLQEFMQLLGDRYRQREGRTGMSYDKSKLGTVRGTLPFYHLQFGNDSLVASRTMLGWDICLTTLERHLDALILQKLLLERLGARAVVLSSGEPVA